MSAMQNRRQILFSTDGHAGADVLAYKPYLEERYHQRFDEWAATYHDAWLEGLDRNRDPNHRIGVASADGSGQLGCQPATEASRRAGHRRRGVVPEYLAALLSVGGSYGTRASYT